jgi:acyl transferase domain-containing protein
MTRELTLQAGAYAAGALDLKTAIIVAYYRGQIVKNSQIGAMAAVGLGSKELKPYLRDGVVVACENSPQSSTISGDVEQLDLVLKHIQEELPDVFTRRLRVDIAYHSRK